MIISYEGIKKVREMIIPYQSCKKGLVLTRDRTNTIIFFSNYCNEELWLFVEIMKYFYKFWFF